MNFSVPTLDPEVWRRTEPGTAPPRQRLRALRVLVDAGIKAGVGMAPLLLGISDRPEQLAEVIRASSSRLPPPPSSPSPSEGRAGARAERRENDGAAPLVR